jgi:hypothetical protein
MVQERNQVIKFCEVNDIVRGFGGTVPVVLDRRLNKVMFFLIELDFVIIYFLSYT